MRFSASPLNYIILFFLSEAYLKYAHGIISEYLPEDISAKLYQHLKLPVEENLGMKRKSVTPLEQKDSKKVKMENEENVSASNYSVKSDAIDLSKSEKVSET